MRKTGKGKSDITLVCRSLMRAALLDEATDLMAAARNEELLGTLQLAVDLIEGRPKGGKVVTSGMGKSGLVARHIAAMFNCTGQPAVFLHPVEALHGDLGVIAPEDVLLLVSRSGSTPELLGLLSHLRSIGVENPSICILGEVSSSLATKVDLLLQFTTEASYLYGRLPITAAALATAIGDALAVGLMGKRRIDIDDLRLLHPAGYGDAQS